MVISKGDITMVSFVDKLEKDTDKRVKKILTADLNILKKSYDAAMVFENAFNRLKEFISTYQFANENEEIEFFKIIKPRLVFRLIYYRKIYNIEMNRPAGIQAQRNYLIDEIKAINRYNSKRSDFVRYYKSGLTHLDHLYYRRGQSDTTLYLDSNNYERDPKFSTCCDFKVARLLANDLLINYLTQEINKLDIHSIDAVLPRARITWQGTKTELVEQIFAWDSLKIFGDIPTTQLYDYIQKVFNIELDKNFSRTFSDLRIRNKQTPFLDNLKEALLKKMSTYSRKRYK